MLSTSLDLLELPLESDEGIARAGQQFIADFAWRLARYGEHRLKGGWWVFECRGEGDLSSVEVRLSSSADPLIVLSAQDSTRLFLHGGESFLVALLVSPWPYRRRFSMLRLRRLQPPEEFALMAAGASRLLRRDMPLKRIASVAKRLLARQVLGVRLSATSEKQERSQARVWERAAPTEFVVAQGRDCCAVIAAGDRLSACALDIVGREFARFEHVQAIYSDCREEGNITPQPEWDDDFAKVASFVGPPVFFRGSGDSAGVNPWARLKEVSTHFGSAAIRRIALPLAERDIAIKPKIERPDVPNLPRIPRVSVLIPTKYQVDLLEKCLAGLVDRTGYPNLEVIVIDNGCEDPRFHQVLAKAGRRLDIVLVEDRGSFNFPRLIDSGVKRSSGEVLLLLNDDIEPIESGWLHRMIASVLEPGVGAVGARLIYPNGDIQHAGVMLGLGGVCGHLWKGMPPGRAAINARIALPGRRAAVTGACLAVRRELYNAIGGLDQAAFPVALNDIDFCLRLSAQGYRTMYRGDAILVHHESQSRGPDDATIESRKRLAAETRIFLERWRLAAEDDPYGSPAFDRRSESGAVHPALLRPWPAG
ncbi:MAG: glycosyltransferase [Novosphingobium sp.]|nr:glycosyltransferase [Novosphingobium sp.]